MHKTFVKNKTLFLTLFFVILYSATIALATPPTYNTLDPDCLPTDPACSIAFNTSTIAENTNLYFTNARARDAALTLDTHNSFMIGGGISATGNAYSVFIGDGAGVGADTNTTRSNFIGSNAGRDASSAYSSNFFGNGAGRNATNAFRSNFLGSLAGNGASNAANSNIFGFQTGMSFTGNNLGSNNIIIGTNISLPNATANAINIGGVLFGTGTYSTTSGNPRITPVSGGRIGIGINSPNHTLDVNGNIGLSTSSYIHFGTTSGSSGYGFRDNAGTLEYKNSGGNWNSFSTVAGAVTSLGIPSGSNTNGGSIANNTLTLSLANGTNPGLLSSTDWTTFNNKQNALTNPVTGTGAAGQVSFWNGTSSIAGDNNFFWDNTNKRLGIGTTSPLVSLDVVGAISASTSLTATAGNLQLTDAYKINWTGGSSFIEAAASYMRFATNGAERMRINAGGSVGIGTSTLSSSTRLDIQGTDVGSTKALIVRNSAGTDNFSVSNNGQVNIQGSTNIVPMSGGSAYIQIRNNATGYMTVQGDTSYGLLLNPNGGNVGIGTAAPTNILSLGNGAARKIWIENSGLGVAGQTLTVSAGSTIDGSPNVNGGNLILQSGLATGVSASSILFQTGTTLAGGSTLQTYSTKMIIQGNGSVGIANNTPFTGLSGMLGVDIGVFNTAGAEGNLMVRGYASLGGISRGAYGAVGSNYYLETTTGTLRRRFSDNVSMIDFAAGGFYFRTGGSGAAGSAITTTELARMLPNGNFLIGGTTDGGFKLDVTGTFRSSGSATIGGNIALTGGVRINFATGGGFIEGADTYLRFATNAGTERARINNAGNFGIGTASPLSTLHVSDTSGAGIYVERVATPSTTSGGAVTILNNGSAPISGQRLGSLYMGDTTLGAGGSAAIMGFADGTFSTGVIPGSLRFYTTGASGATLNERMRIDSLGNVGIGATAPTFRLQVEENINGNGGMFVRNSNTGTSTIAAINVAANTGNTSLRTYSSTHSVFPLTGGFFTDSLLTGGMLIFNGANAPTMFYTNSSERMRITSGGNVGIGLSTPTNRLSVVGIAGDTTVMNISTTGGNTCSFSTTAGTWSCASDRNLKKDVTALTATDTLTKLRLLAPVTFKYNWQQDTESPIPGFIAQEFETVFPELVRTDATTGYKSLSYAPLMPYAIKAIQELDIQMRAFTPDTLDATASAKIKTFLTDITNNIINIKDLFAETVHVEKGLEIKDQATGTIYCVVIQNGDWVKTPGGCDAPILAPQENPVVSPTPDPVPEVAPTPDPAPDPAPTPEPAPLSDTPPTE